MPDHSVVRGVVGGYQYQCPSGFPRRRDPRRDRHTALGREQSPYPLVSAADLKLVGRGDCGTQQASETTWDSASDDGGEQVCEMGRSPGGLGTKRGDRGIRRADVLAKSPGNPLGRTTLAGSAGASIKAHQLFDVVS